MHALHAVAYLARSVIYRSKLYIILPPRVNVLNAFTAVNHAVNMISYSGHISIPQSTLHASSLAYFAAAIVFSG
jgi:hypothetical protein